MKNLSSAFRKQSVYIALGIIAAIQIFLLFRNEETYGGADNIQHFQIARYAFKYPHLFLDLWGKPVYTALLAPFAQFGFKAGKLLNLLLAMLTIVLTVRLSEKLMKGSALFAILLIAFSPVYFFLTDTCLTEVLFSLDLVLAVYLFAENKYALSAIVLSFIPFIRSEGMILFPVFAVAFFLRKYYGQVLLFSVGTIFFSLIGFFAFGDLLWIPHRFPYSMGQSVYGSGSLFHFVKNGPFIFGVPFLIFLVPGLFYWLYQVLRKFSLKDENLILFILIAGSWMAYFAAHSYVWWKGTGGSLGLTRVIGGVIPLAALTAVKGMEFISEKIKPKYIAVGITSFFAVAQIFMLFHRYDVPLKKDQVETLIAKSSTYLKQADLPGEVYYFDPEFVFQLGIDPYDQSKSNWGIADKMQPSNSMNDGDVLIWDAHFGPNEGGVGLENVMNDPHLQLIKSFIPDERITVLGGFDYGIYIFRKVDQKTVQEKKQTVEKSLDFSQSNTDRVTETEGRKWMKMDAGMEFSPAIQVPLSEIQARDFMAINAALTFIPEDELGNDQVLLILSVDLNHKSVSYNKLDLKTTLSGDSKIKEAALQLKLAADFPAGAVMNLYVWNKDKKKLLLGDLKLQINGF
jgi:hypothetical protein